MGLPTQLIGQTAGVIALLSFIPYVIDIFKGNTKPSRSAYAIWLVIDTVTAASYLAAGGRATAYINVVYAVCSLAIFILSLKYGMGGHSRFDFWCLVLAAISIAIWVTTHNPVIALYMNILAGKVGYLPVIKKSYSHPSTENLLSWAMSAFASILNLFALTSLSLHVALLPVSSAVVQALVVILLLQPRKQTKAAAQTMVQ